MYHKVFESYGYTSQIDDSTCKSKSVIMTVMLINMEKTIGNNEKYITFKGGIRCCCKVYVYTVDSRYLEVEGTLRNTS